MADSNTQLTLPDELRTSEVKEDILQAMWYFHYRLTEHYTMQQTAEALGWTHRDTVYKALARWKKNGAFQKAEEIIVLPQIVEAQLANQKVIQQWPEVINRQLDIAIHSRSDMNSTQAANFLKEQVYDDIMEKVAEAGANESAYAKRPSDEAPDIIALPKHLVKHVTVTKKPDEA